MPKPTLLQTILGKPSQTYHHPQERDYHSTRDELFRIANATKVLPGHLSFSESGFDSATTTPGNSDSEHQPQQQQEQSHSRRQSQAARPATGLARPPAISAVLSDGTSSELMQGISTQTGSSRRSSAMVSGFHTHLPFASRLGAGCAYQRTLAHFFDRRCTRTVSSCPQAASYPLHRVILLLRIIQDRRRRHNGRRQTGLLPLPAAAAAAITTSES
ncbi:hypothetical protein PYCCODRAFT_472860 [Trametes coccinea BRFM310]|uniref:Uncharacterized protein n=1 Tax=Trametes coccinea (strain BRFM310) TaxID=1353009 RepID=A0A1Y2IKV8_TRAC3|nr:hypothetical protein PYCCODRAFT_472860 [Trametes coccinea BRFM310]